MSARRSERSGASASAASSDASSGEGPNGKRPFDPALVDEIANLLSASDLTEIEVEKGDLRIRVARTRAAQIVGSAPVSAPVAVTASPAPPAAAPSADTPVAAAAARHPDALTSPMVGTVYRRPSPGTKAFVEVGSIVRAGEKVLLIEAMKTFNDIVAPRAGTVRTIFVEDGQPVEYGEPLIVIE